MSSSKRPSSKHRKPSRDQIPIESPTGSSDDMYGERLNAPQRVRKAPFPSRNSRHSSNSPPPRRRRNHGDSHTAKRAPSPSRRLSDPFDDPAHPPRRPRSRSRFLSEQIEHGTRQRHSQDQRPSPQVARRGSRSRSRSRRSSPRPSAFSGSTLIGSSRPLPYSSGIARPQPQPRSPQPAQRRRPESAGDGCTNALMTRGERAQHGRAFTFLPCLREPVWETVVRRETIVIKKKKKKKKKGPDTSREGERKKRK